MDGVHPQAGSPALNGGAWGTVGFDQPQHHTLHHHSSHLSLHAVHEEHAAHPLSHSVPHTPGIPQHAYSPMAPSHEYGYFSDHLAQHSPGLMHPEQDYRMQQAPDLGYQSMHQWGGMVGTPTTPNPPQHSPTYMPPTAVHHIQPAQTLPTMSQQPASVPMTSTVSNHSTHTTSTARRTLTDADRRQMCLYHEENPNVKQTVIGAMFGVERSTVSKVLRQKDKYLYPDDGSRSPVKRTKGKFPDIERALAVWVRNRRQDTPLTDEAIRDQAWHFAMTTGVSEAQFKANNGPGWLEKFKQKNNLTTVKEGGLSASKSRMNLKAEAQQQQQQQQQQNQQQEGQPQTSTTSEAQENAATAPAMSQSISQDSHHAASGSPESYLDYGYKHTPNSVSTTSLSSMYTDPTNGAFSTGPTSPASPFFPNQHSSQPSPSFTPQSSRLQPPPSAAQAALSNHRPRSQTFPRVSVDPTSYMSPPPSSDALTPKLMVGGESMLTPPNASSPQQTPPGSASLKPSREEARRALETLIGYLSQEPVGSVCDPGEYSVVQGLLNRLSMEGNGALKEEGRSPTPVSGPGGGGFMALMEGAALSGI